jgi:hypothetical protein
MSSRVSKANAAADKQRSLENSRQKHKRFGQMRPASFLNIR